MIAVFRGRTCVSGRQGFESTKSATAWAEEAQAASTRVGQQPQEYLVVDVKTQRVLAKVSA